MFSCPILLQHIPISDDSVADAERSATGLSALVSTQDMYDQTNTVAYHSTAIKRFDVYSRTSKSRSHYENMPMQYTEIH